MGAMTEIDTDTAIRALGRSDLQHDPEALKTFNGDVVEEFRANSGKVDGTFAVRISCC